MKIFRRWYWIATGFLKKYMLGLAIGVVVGIIAVVNFQLIIDSLPISRTQNIGRVGIVTLSTIPLDIQYQVSRGLTTFSPTGEVVPDLAQNISVSEDGKTYTVTLDPHLYWSDGSRLTAHDIEIQVADVEVEVAGDDTIIFKLKEAYSPFTSLLSQPLLKKDTVGTLRRRTHIIGVNDYRITDIQIQNSIITSIKLSAPKHTIKYYFYPTENEAVIAFKLGHIDTIVDITNPYLDDWPNVSLTFNVKTDRYLAVFFNTADPSLQEKSLRQMLAYAIPKPVDDSRVISPISKDSWAYNPQVKRYAYSLEQAQEIYAKQKEANPNFDLNIELTTTPAYAHIAQEIIQSWRLLGIQASIKIVSFPDTNSYQALLIGQQIPRDPDQYALWHSTQSSNITKYQNPKIDKLLEDGRKEYDREKRKLVYQDFQRFIIEDSPAVFLYNLMTYTLSRTRS